MEEKEIWKDIEGFEGMYQVSNMGRVKSLGNGKSDNSNYSKERILKASKLGAGYLKVNLYKDGIKKTCGIHRLVANAFIPNPSNLPQVNHKDENKENNCVTNLEWCSHEYNNNYGTRNQRVSEKKKGRKMSEESIKKRSKPVIGVDKVTGLIVEFGSAHEAERKLGIFSSNITKCCKGKYKSMGGFYWYYADSDTE